MNPACQSCERRLYKAGGALRCIVWKIHTTITRCSEYIGPHPEMHFKLEHGPDYADTLAHSRSKKTVKPAKVPAATDEGKGSSPESEPGVEGAEATPESLLDFEGIILPE